MKLFRNTMIWLIVPIAFVSLGMAFIVHVAMPLPDSKLIGCFFLAIGIFNIFFARTLGSRLYTQALNHPVLGWFWLRCGEKGTQFLFLGIASTLIIAGCFLLVFGNT